MKKLFLLSMAVAMILTSWTGYAEEQKSPLPDKVLDVRYEKCPISGGKVQANVFTMIDGKVYHFCCPACIKPFEKEFKEKVKAIVNPTEVVLKIANVDGKCPKTGKPALPGIFRVNDDSITFYCCDKCPPKLEIKDMDDDDEKTSGSASGSGAVSKEKKDEKPASDKPVQDNE